MSGGAAGAVWRPRDALDGVPCRRYFERGDGAYVWYDLRTPYVNPERAGFRPWIAFGADGRTLKARPRRDRRGRGVVRRWQTAAAAMAALDRTIPWTEG